MLENNHILGTLFFKFFNTQSLIRTVATACANESGRFSPKNTISTKRSKYTCTHELYKGGYIIIQ